jgi:type II secretory pathway pseudopilin PulG
MQAPLEKSDAPGFSTLELVIVLGMISVIAGFAVVSIVRGNRAASCTRTAVEIANYLQKARNDSIRRQAKEMNQMAQVKIFNRKLYSIAIDGDNDGYLDVPLVMTLPDQPGLEINGPFPKTYIFDWQGQTVDSQNHRMASPPLTIGNSSGASAIKFSDDGTITVVPAVKLTATR